MIKDETAYLTSDNTIFNISIRDSPHPLMPIFFSMIPDCMTSIFFRSAKSNSLLYAGHCHYHKWSLTICDGCFDTLKSSKMRS